MSPLADFIRRTFKGTPLFPALKRIFYWGSRPEQWMRVVMNRSTLEIVNSLSPASLSVLEISGDAWADRTQFKSYRSANFPEFDICEGPLAETFDLIIAEQVFEHLLRPYAAAKNVYAMLKPGGYFLITTPFLVKVHDFPHDCSRWTELGLKYFLAEAGFPLDSIKTYSWGNRACVVGNFTWWAPYRRHFHSLRNEPDFPLMVWALARKATA